MDKLRQILADVIYEMEDAQRQAAVAPVCVPLPEIRKELDSLVKETLNSMVRDGQLYFHRNINGIIMFHTRQSLE